MLPQSGQFFFNKCFKHIFIHLMFILNPLESPIGFLCHTVLIYRELACKEKPMDPFNIYLINVYLLLNSLVEPQDGEDYHLTAAPSQ